VSQSGMPVYRFFEHAEHRDAFVSGWLRLGTLERYRRDEHPDRGDPNEASVKYKLDLHIGERDTPFDRVQMKRAGIGVGDSATFKDCYFDVTSSNRIFDAWVLCFTSLASLPELGGYGVRINYPTEMFNRVSRELFSKHGMDAFSGNAINPVSYNPIEYTGLEPEPGVLGFVKEPRFAKQSELRMIWIPKGQRVLDYEYVSCPGMRELCEPIE
jgi:hypothetical protein